MKINKNSIAIYARSILAIAICTIAFSFCFVKKSSAYYNSLIEWENNAMHIGQGTNPISFIVNLIPELLNCFITAPMYNMDAFANSCLPLSVDINKNQYSGCEGVSERKITNDMKLGMAIFAIATAALISSITASAFVVGLIALVAIVSFYFIPFFAICQSIFIVAPNEYLNHKMKTLRCGRNIFGKVENQYRRTTPLQPAPVSEMEVPYFYKCMPNGEVRGDDPTAKYIDQLVCSTKLGDNIMDAQGDDIGEGSIIIAVDNTNISRGNKLCNIKDAVHASSALPSMNPYQFARSEEEIRTYYMTRNDIVNIAMNKASAPTIQVGASFSLVPYYDIINGNAMLCVAATSIATIPIIAGCSTIAPPKIAFVDNSAIATLLSDTRCEYFNDSRLDLYTLGKSIYDQNEFNGANQFVAKFLMSDLHFFSTVFGCFQDLLEKLLYYPVGSDYGFLAKVFSAMHKTIMLILALYLTIIGVKILTSPNLQKSELFGYIIKILLISLFTLTDFWLPSSPIFNSSDTIQEKRVGGYSFLIDGLMSKTADIFIQSGTALDPMRVCQYNFGDQNILSTRYIRNQGDGLGTHNPRSHNSSYVRMSFIDMFECTIFNILSFKTCQFNPDGLFVLWMPWMVIISTIFGGFSGGTVLFLAMLVYVILVLQFALRILHIALISVIVITMLVIIGPLFVCLAIFDTTKDIFTNWFKSLITYAIYPSLCFAYFSLYIIVFDAIFYGNVGELRRQVDGCKGSNSATCIQFEKICNEENDSMYCGLYKNSSAIALCDMSSTEASSIFFDRRHFPPSNDGALAIVDWIMGFDYLSPKGPLNIDFLHIGSSGGAAGFTKMILIGIIFALMFENTTAVMQQLIDIGDPADVAKGNVTSNVIKFNYNKSKHNIISYANKFKEKYRDSNKIGSSGRGRAMSAFGRTLIDAKLDKAKNKLKSFWDSF